MKAMQLLSGFWLLMAAAAPVRAASLSDWIGPEQALELASGALREIQFGDTETRLLPRHEKLRSLIQDHRKELGPNILVESLSLYAKPPKASSPVWSKAERTGLFNQCLGISSLTGIQYYSSSRNAMRTFYETSQVIDGPDTKKPLPDPVLQDPPGTFTLYARQRDLTFGDNIYQFDYYNGEDAFFFVQRNLTAMNMGIIPGVSPNNLRSVIAVLDAGEYLLIYGVSMAKAPSLPGLRERIGNSFSTRVEAVLDWFNGRADGAFN
jgi:hypothetical protein